MTQRPLLLSIVALGCLAFLSVKSSVATVPRTVGDRTAPIPSSVVNPPKTPPQLTPSPEDGVSKLCSGVENRQMDFWVGEWRVFEASDNTEVGSSKIELVMEQCGIKESFEAPNNPGGRYIGTSYSSWDRKDGKWHQFYIDNNGSVQLYVGGPDAKDMTFEAPAPKGATLRMIYRQQSDGSVRQIGTTSKDGGKTWAPGYDYIYRRK